MNFDRFGGRRWLLAQQVFIASCALLAFGKLNGGEWVTVTLGIAGVYVAGNVAQKRIDSADKSTGASNG